MPALQGHPSRSCRYDKSPLDGRGRSLHRQPQASQPGHDRTVRQAGARLRRPAEGIVGHARHHSCRWQTVHGKADQTLCMQQEG